MTCDLFEARLDALLAGTCTPEQWREAEAHVETCARCRRLFEAMAGRSQPLSPDREAALTASVLARTAGVACDTARDRLCSLLDGELAPFDRDLIEGHLAHCPSCRELAQVLERIEPVLSTFAEIPPPERFERDVLASTSRRPSAPSVGERIAEWLARAAQRPRFALEVAYACTLILLLVFGDPVKAYREVSTRAQPRVEGMAQAISRPLSSARQAGADTLSSVGRKLRPVVDELKPGASGARGTEPGLAGGTWWREHVTAPLRAFGSWAARTARATVDQMINPRPAPARQGEPERKGGPRASARTEPGARLVR